eukprot:TRINITY_DN869_c0_g1_i7.p1 TRINITY_DN869_c0_g1~~TRINITY_DN869_c0_g1_i7.p1  ORF type:complete len:452 (+),score=47.54 TRINITY_DN869_c0_g1_i7:254-1609(+)
MKLRAASSSKSSSPSSKRLLPAPISTGSRTRNCRTSCDSCRRRSRARCSLRWRFPREWRRCRRSSLCKAWCEDRKLHENVMMKSIVDSVLEALDSDVRTSVADRLVQHIKKQQESEESKVETASSKDLGKKLHEWEDRGLSRINEDTSIEGKRSEAASKKSSERYKSDAHEVFGSEGQDYGEDRCNEDEELIEENMGGVHNDEEVVECKGGERKKLHAESEPENPFGNNNMASTEMDKYNDSQYFENGLKDYEECRNSNEMPFGNQTKESRKFDISQLASAKFDHIHTPDSNNSPILGQGKTYIRGVENEEGTGILESEKENQCRDSGDDVRTSDISDEGDRRPAPKSITKIGHIINPFKGSPRVVKVVEPGCNAARNYEEIKDYRQIRTRPKGINERNRKPIKHDTIITSSVSHVSCGRFVTNKLNDMCNYVEEQTNCLIFCCAAFYSYN